MSRLRFHIGTFVIVILLLGICLAAMRESNEAWDSSIFSLTLGVLSISIPLAIHRTEKRRAFWLGFALFGSAYLGMSLVPAIESRLITTRALAFLDSEVPRPNQGELGYFEYASEGVIDLYVANNSLFSWNNLVGTLPNGSSGTTEHFVRIGHSVLAIVAALLGGQISRYLHGVDSSASDHLLSRIAGTEIMGE
jgi:hypothetical protein